MAPIKTITFTRDGKRYDVQISLDDQAIMNDRLTFEVSAKVTPPDGPPFEKALALELDLVNRRGAILDGDERLHEFEFSDVDVRMSDGVETPGGMNKDSGLGTDAVGDFVGESIGRQIEAIIEAMPVPDPILGCALKAGISSTLGQALTCNEMVGPDGPMRRRLWAIARCMADHGGGLLTRTLWRGLRCMASLGLV